MNTSTFDNDKGFSGHQSIGSALGANTHFTRPYPSKDNGTVENRIGQLCRFFPQKPIFKQYPMDELKNCNDFLTVDQ